MKTAIRWLILLLLAGPAGAEPPAPPAGDGVLRLDPVKIQGEAVCSYAIGIKVLVDRKIKQTSLVITEVVEGSDASQLGLQPGDEIVRINGVAVADMDPTIEKKSPLGRIFLNRRPGDPLDLDVVTVRKRGFTLRARTVAAP